MYMYIYIYNNHVSHLILLKKDKIKYGINVVLEIIAFYIKNILSNYIF